MGRRGRKVSNGWDEVAHLGLIILVSLAAACGAADVSWTSVRVAVACAIVSWGQDILRSAGRATARRGKVSSTPPG